MYYVEIISENGDSTGSFLECLEWYTESELDLDQTAKRAMRFAKILAEKGEVSMVVWRHGLDAEKRRTLFMKVPVGTPSIAVVIHWLTDNGRPLMQFHERIDVTCFDAA